MFEFRNMNQELGKNMLKLPTWKKAYNKLAGGIKTKMFSPDPKISFKSIFWD